MKNRTALVSTATVLAAVALTTGAMLGRDSSDGTDPRSLRARRVNVAPNIPIHMMERGNPAGIPVVMLHGLSDSWQSFERLNPYMPMKYRLIAVDLRGHGESAKSSSKYTMVAMAEDVRVLMDSLGLSSAYVVGHSLGTMVAQQLAARHPDRVKGLVLIAGGRTGRQLIGLEEFNRALDVFEDPNAPVTDAFARDFQVSTLYAPMTREFVDSTVVASLRLPVRAWKAIGNEMLVMKEAEFSSPIPFPTLLLWGDKDSIAPRAEQDALARKFNAQFIKFSETGHAVHWERPEAVARELQRFFRSDEK